MICIYCLGTFIRPTYPPEHGPDYCSAQCARLDLEETEARALPPRIVTSPQPRPAGMNFYKLAPLEQPVPMSDGTLATHSLTLEPKK